MFLIKNKIKKKLPQPEKNEAPTPAPPKSFRVFKSPASAPWWPSRKEKPRAASPKRPGILDPERPRKIYCPPNRRRKRNYRLVIALPAFGRLSAELDNYQQQQQLSESESESASLPVASAKVGRKMLILSLAAQTKRFQHLLD